MPRNGREEGRPRRGAPRASGAEELSAWGPGGWSREHGRELHGAVPLPSPEGASEKPENDEAPTG